VLGRPGAFADPAGDDVVSGCEIGGGDGGDIVGGLDRASVCLPGVDGLQPSACFEIDDATGDADGIAGKDGDGLDHAAIGGGKLLGGPAEAEDSAGAEAVCGDLGYSSVEEGGRGVEAEVDVGVLDVRLDGSQGEAVVQRGVGQDVIKAGADGGAVSPGAGLDQRASCAGSAEEQMGEGDVAAVLDAVDGAGLGDVGAVVGAVGGGRALDDGAEVVAEVSGHAADSALDDGLVGVAVEGAVEGMEVGVSAEEVETRWDGFLRSRGRCLGQSRERDKSGERGQQKRADELG